MPTPANSLNITEAGVVTFDGVSVFHGRTLTAGTGISITNGSGVSGNPVISSSAANTDLHVAKLIVNAAGTSSTGANYSTITAAMADAVSGETIFVMPGTYTENFTWKAGVDIYSFDSEWYTPQVEIVGKITCTDAGTRTISGMRLRTNGDFFLSMSGSNLTQVLIKNCSLVCSNNTGISFAVSNVGSTIDITNCDGDISTTGISYYTMTSTGDLRIRYVNAFSNSGGSTTASSNSAGRVFISYSKIYSPISCTSTGVVDIRHCELNEPGYNFTPLQTAGSGSSNSYHNTFVGGSSTAVIVGTSTTFNSFNDVISSSNTAAISGGGTLIYSGMSFAGTSSLITVTTQTPYVSSNNAFKVVSASGASYTTVPQDLVILVNGAVTATVVPLASPATGQRHIIKDNSGTASANNITVTPSGKNIDGSASSVININYGSLEIVYNGTQWNVI